jgi:hypothetical protein
VAITPERNEEEYPAALKILDHLMSPIPTTDETPSCSEASQPLQEEVVFTSRVVVGTTVT